MSAVPSFVIDPIWDQFQALIPTAVDTFIALANAITTRRLIREAWTRYRWNTRPTRQP